MTLPASIVVDAMWRIGSTTAATKLLALPLLPSN